MVSKNSLLQKAHPMQYLDVLLLASSIGAELLSPVLQGCCLQQPEPFSAVLKTKSNLSRTLYTNQASAGRMTFLSTLHARLSSQLIREFLREKRNLWNLLAVEGWISALWSSYAKPITSSSLWGAELCQTAPLLPLSPLWELFFCG